MRIVNTLRRLAARAPSPWPMLSVYVNTRPVGSQMLTYRPLLKKRMAEELAQYPARSPERESLAVDFARVQHYLDYDLRPETRSAAVFSSYADDDGFDAVQLPLEFREARVVVGPGPLLGPLLAFADRDPRAVAVIADEKAARLYVSALGAVTTRREVRAAASPTPDPSRFAADAGQALADLAAESGAELAFLGGDAVVVGAIRAATPAGAPKPEVVDWDPKLTEEAIAIDVAARLEARRVAARTADARDTVREAATGAAVLGAEPVRAALEAGRARALLLGAEGCEDGRCEDLGRLALVRGIPILVIPAGADPAFDEAGVAARLA